MSKLRETRASRALFLIGRSVMLQLIRRQEFYVLFILMGLFLVGVMSVSVVGIEEAATATFLLNLGMSVAYYAALVLTVILSARQIPDEIEKRTLYPLLAKPVDRATLYLGKWLACSVSGMGVYIILFLMGWLAVPKMEDHSEVLLTQTLLLQLLSITMLSGLGLLLSLLVPRGINIVILLLWAGFGSKFIGLSRAKAAGSLVEDIVRWITAYVPDFSKFNLATRYTDGVAPLGAGEFAVLFAYGLFLTLWCLLPGILLFRRQRL